MMKNFNLLVVCGGTIISLNNSDAPTFRAPLEVIDIEVGHYEPLSYPTTLSLRFEQIGCIRFAYDKCKVSSAILHNFIQAVNKFFFLVFNDKLT